MSIVNYNIFRCLHYRQRYTNAMMRLLNDTKLIRLDSKLSFKLSMMQSSQSSILATSSRLSTLILSMIWFLTSASNISPLVLFFKPPGFTTTLPHASCTNDSISMVQSKYQAALCHLPCFLLSQIQTCNLLTTLLSQMLCHTCHSKQDIRGSETYNQSIGFDRCQIGYTMNFLYQFTSFNLNPPNFNMGLSASVIGGWVYTDPGAIFHTGN